MRRFLQAIGAIFLLLLAVIVGLIFYMVSAGAKLDESSKMYVDRVVPGVVAHWSPEVLLRNAAPQLLEANSEEEVREFFSELAVRLGPLKKFDGSKGEALVSMTPAHGRHVAANYQVQATFEHGVATIRITLMQRQDGGWLISSFLVDPHPLR